MTSSGFLHQESRTSLTDVAATGFTLTLKGFKPHPGKNSERRLPFESPDELG